MAIDGRINVDVLFHDTDGTTSLKVVSLEDAAAYTTGKVAVVTGTCGTSAVTVALASSGYKDAAGSDVTFSSISRLAFSATGIKPVKCQEASGDAVVFSDGGRVSVTGVKPSGSSLEVNVDATAGTASYTLVLYGT